MWQDRHEVFLNWAGLLAVFVLTCLPLVVSAYLILNGAQVAGTILGSADLVALVAIFITRRRSGRISCASRCEIWCRAPSPANSRTSLLQS